MNGETLRQGLATMAIAGAIIVADWMFIAAPALARRDAAQARLDRASETLAALDLPAGANRNDALDTLRERATRIEESGALAREPLRIYDAILALADQNNVQIDRMDPTAAGGALSDEAVIATGFEIEALGAFEDVLHFMDAIERDAGYARIAAASLEPRVINNERVVTAVIRTRHFAFNLGEAQALLDGEGSAP